MKLGFGLQTCSFFGCKKIPLRVTNAYHPCLQGLYSHMQLYTGSAGVETLRLSAVRSAVDGCEGESVLSMHTADMMGLLLARAAVQPASLHLHGMSVARSSDQLVATDRHLIFGQQGLLTSHK